MISISVIIPTYNRLDYLKDAIISVQSQNFEFSQYEIIVVENGPETKSKKLIADLNKNGGHEVIYIHEPCMGLHNARHLGAKKSRGEIVVYIDDDVIVSPDWLRAYLDVFSDEQIVCVSGKVLPQWEAERPEWLQQFHPGNLSLLDLGESQMELKYPRGVFGCNMGFRRSVIFDLGGFHPDGFGDRRLIWYRGDGETGLYKKIAKKNYLVIYEPKALLYHRIPLSRLTPEYFYWRNFIQGISDSFTRVREIGLKNHFSGYLVSHGLYCLALSLKYYVNSIMRPSKTIRSRAYSNYWRGRGLHQLRAWLFPGFFDYIIKESYLTKENI